jgi:hypothetical protein
MVYGATGGQESLPLAEFRSLARLVRKYHPLARIFVVVFAEQQAKAASLVRGLTPILLDPVMRTKETPQLLEQVPRLVSVSVVTYPSCAGSSGSQTTRLAEQGRLRHRCPRTEYTPCRDRHEFRFLIYCALDHRCTTATQRPRLLPVESVAIVSSHHLVGGACPLNPDRQLTSVCCFHTW